MVPHHRAAEHPSNFEETDMTRTIQTIAALAVICLSAPAFAHGSGHGGMNMGGNMGGNGHNGPSMNSKNSMSWNKVDNKSGQTTSHHHDNFTKIKLIWKQQQIMHLRTELRRLVMLQQKTTNPVALAKIRMEIHRVLVRLFKDGALNDPVTAS